MADGQGGAVAEQFGFDAGRLSRMPDFFEQNYIAAGKLPNMALFLSRGGETIHESYRGTFEMNGGGPAIGPDTIFRIYSMTKPVTSVCAAMLIEEARLRLNEPVAKYLPEFSDVEVLSGGTAKAPETRPADRPMLIRDLFTHTSGITYGFLMQDAADAIYRQHRIGQPSETLREMARRIAKLPLAFSPGERWLYGNSTDVLGAIVEVIEDRPLDEVFRSRVFSPLGMADTGFFVPEGKQHRLPPCYSKDPGSHDITTVGGSSESSDRRTERPLLLNAGGGLTSTVRDYAVFARMLCAGGAHGGQRLLSPKTVQLMMSNHLPDGRTIKQMGDVTFSEVGADGNGFGLGGSVLVDVAGTGAAGTEGLFAWGGLASTFFWIDPAEDLVAVQATQLMPSSSYPIRPQFQAMTYGAMTRSHA